MLAYLEPVETQTILLPTTITPDLCRRVLASAPVPMLRREMGRRGWNEVSGARTADLIGELQRRGHIVVHERQRVRLGDLTIDAEAGRLEWRGAAYTLSARRMEVLAYLANIHPHRANYQDMGTRLFGSLGAEGAVLNARVLLSDLKKLLPGLISTARTGTGSCRDIWLNVGEEV